MKVPVKNTTTTTTTANRGESAIDLQEDIRRRAYELYERRGWEAGHEIEDWLQAEAELAAERNKPVEVAAVKKTRKPPVTGTAKTKAKQAKKMRSPVQSKTQAE